MQDTVLRGAVEWSTLDVTMTAEIQRNSDGTWSGLVRRLSGAVITRPTKETLLLSLSDLHSSNWLHDQPPSNGTGPS